MHDSRKTATQKYISWPIPVRVVLGVFALVVIMGVFYILHLNSKHDDGLGWPDYSFAMITVSICLTVAVPEIMLPVISKISPTVHKRLSAKFRSPIENNEEE